MLCHKLCTTDGCRARTCHSATLEKRLHRRVLWVEPHLDVVAHLATSQLLGDDVLPPVVVGLAAHELHPAPEALGKVPVGVVHAGTRRPLRGDR